MNYLPVGDFRVWKIASGDLRQRASRRKFPIPAKGGCERQLEVRDTFLISHEGLI